MIEDIRKRYLKLNEIDSKIIPLTNGKIRKIQRFNPRPVYTNLARIPRNFQVFRRNIEFQKVKKVYLSCRS